MKPITQTILNATNGNCFAACIASLLEVPCDEVPNIHDYPESDNEQNRWFYKLNVWLMENHHCALLMYEPQPNRIWLPDNVPFIVSAITARGNNHCAIMCYSEGKTIKVHNPYPDGGSAITDAGPVYMYFLVKL